MRLQAPHGANRDVEFAWPELVAPDDPWAGDEALADPASTEAYQRRGGTLSPEEHQHWDRCFLEAYRNILSGRSGWDACAIPAARLGLDGPVRHDRRWPRPSRMQIPDRTIADFAENWVPDIGMVAPDRVLGPWADEELPRRLRQLAGAVMAFAPILAPASRPIGRAVRSRPRPPVTVRSGLISVLRAPVVAWEIRGDRLVPLLPLAAGWVPRVAVGGLPRGARGLVARLTLGPQGWWPACALPLPVVPDPRLIERRMHLEYLRWRRHEPRLTFEDLLRDRGEVVYRTVCEWLWMVIPARAHEFWWGLERHSR